MGAIGGIVDFRNGNIDFSAFNAISKAQILRGRKSSVAYVDSNVGMFYNSDGYFESEQPVLSERRGYKASLVVDSYFLDGRLAMEGYRAYGVEFIGMLDVPFALAIYDAERRMLLLARDKKGKKPLFYCIRAGKVYFSSEPKGILAIQTQSVRISGTALSAHLTSPVGIYSASDIYSDVFEVRSGECILFTELGMSKFFYRENLRKKISSKTLFKVNERPLVANFDIKKSIVFSALEDALIAFDMPQFDIFMPSLCQLFLNVDISRDNNIKNGIFEFKDFQKIQSLSYSYQRDDRLSAFYGKIGVSVIAKTDDEQEQIEKMKNDLIEILTEAFFLIDKDGIVFLRKIFGDTKFNYLLAVFDKKEKRKEDTELIIRILGMIYQTVELSKIRFIEICS